METIDGSTTPGFLSVSINTVRGSEKKSKAICTDTVQSDSPVKMKKGNGSIEWLGAYEGRPSIGP